MLRRIEALLRCMRLRLRPAIRRGHRRHRRWARRRVPLWLRPLCASWIGC